MNRRFAAATLALFALGVVISCNQSPTSPTDFLTTPLSHQTKCIHECNANAKQDRKEERTRFHAAMACCTTPLCQETEETLHEIIMSQIAVDEQECKRNCRHEQGGGHGGQ